MATGVSRTWIGGAIAALIVGAALGLLGPFGTYGDLSTGERYGYWIGLTVLMWLQTAAVFAALRRAPSFQRLPLWLQAGLAALAGSIPTTFEVAYVEGLLRLGRVLSPRSLVETYWSVAVIAVGFFVPLTLLQQGRRAPAPTLDDAGLGRALPRELSGPIVALRAEDHYLRVYTGSGEALVHYRFSDAVRELGDAGVQVHRSWWVARDAVERVERTGDRQTLLLRGGVQAPVSRGFAVPARAAGLIP
jgi:hypothetical protein